jgi:hypothetical protein
VLGAGDRRGDHVTHANTCRRKQKTGAKIRQLHEARIMAGSGHLLFVIGYWLFVIGYCSLVVGERRVAGLLVALVLTWLTACSPTSPGAPGHGEAIVRSPSGVIRLFNGRTLENFNTWLVDHHTDDPERVFSVQQVDGEPAIRISGTIWGGLITANAFRNYRLIAEFRWGGPTYGERATRTRDSGILLHAQGRLGNTARDFNGPWISSIECQIIEGGVGDLILVAGFEEDGTRIQPSVEATTRKDRDGEDVYDPAGLLRTFRSGRVNWSGKSEDWTDRTGFRGANDVETADLGWTRIEVVAEADTLAFSVNGVLVNRASSASVTDGRIMIQSEGAEIFVRKFELHPLR